MAEVVDSVVAELVLRGLQQYEQGFDRATAAHGRFKKSVDALKGQTFDLQAEAQKYRQGGNAIGQAAEQTDQRVTRSRKQRQAASVAADEAEVASAKRSAKAKADAEILEAERAARAKAAVERGLANRAAAVKPGSGRMNTSGAVVQPGDVVAPSFIPASVLNGGASAAAAEAAATEEIDHLTRDIAINKARLVGLEGREREELQREIAYLETINRLKKAGVADTEAMAIAEANVARLQEKQLATARGQILKNLSRFVEGAGVGRSFGSVATVGGIAAAAALYGATSAVGAGIDYGKQLADTAQQIGLTTKQLQLYQTAATQAGISTEQFRSGFGQLNSYLGRAQEGDKQAAKTFQALGVSIKDAGSAGDILPTLIERISSISDPAKRAAVETRLFGEEGRRLDSLLGGGTAKVNALAESMEKAGTALSDRDIADLKEASVALAQLKQQLQVDLSRVVAGNKEAILSLAQSFVVLADKAFGAIQRLQQFGARQVLEGVVSNFASQDDKNTAKAFLLRTHSGRVQLYGEAERQEAAIRAGNGRFDVSAGAPSIAQQQKAALDRIEAQKREIAQAEAASRTPAAPGIQSGKVNAAALGSLFAPNPPKGKSADQLAREAEQRAKRFQDDLSRYQEEQLRAEESLTGDINKRADIERDLADRALKRQVSDIDSEARQNILRGADKKLEQARASELKSAAKAAHDAEVQGIEQQRQLDLTRAASDREQQLLRFQADHLNNELALATTSAERRRIELDLLENAKEQERARLQGVIDTSLPGSLEASAAADQLKTLGVRFDEQRASIIRETETSLEAYRRSLEVTADTISDFGVQVLQDFNQELDHSIAKALHLHGVFGQIVADLIDLAIKQKLIAPAAENGGFGGFLGGIAKLFGAGSPGIDVGGITSATNNLLDSGLPGLASGGMGIIGGNPGIDRNVLSINGRNVAKVGRGELLSVTPNVALANQRVASAVSQQNIVVVQPITANFRGARTDEQTMRAFTAYADARSKQAYEAAVETAGSQVGGIVRRKQTLGN